MRTLIFMLSLCLILGCKKELTSHDILENSIKYHDPNNNWSTFDNTLNVTMSIPEQANRVSTVYINLPEDRFSVKAIRDTLITIYQIDKGNCKVSFNGKTEFTEEEIKDYRLSCENAFLYKDYYTYLYGLPMKLKDPGTTVHDKVERKEFNGKEYLVLKVTYAKDVGTDIWYFYFDPNPFAMEVYQFYKIDDQGDMKEDSGEYILLTEEKEVSGIKMPKIRAWYYNKDDGYLGTDVLK